MYPEEGRPIKVKVMSFEMQIHEVTNGQFQRFVNETGYITEAELGAQQARPGAGSAVFGAANLNQEDLEAGETDPRWNLVKGATWKTPFGPGTSIEGRGLFPVIHISLNDAHEYAKWSGTRVPSESEWEYAASLGLPDPQDQMSGAYEKGKHPIANTWQGTFPSFDSGADGFRGLAPVGCYPPNKMGLFDIVGNAWEWTSSYQDSARAIIKGGSFLCSKDYCRRFRPAARQFQEHDFSTSHIGFRVVRTKKD